MDAHIEIAPNLFLDQAGDLLEAVSASLRCGVPHIFRYPPLPIQFPIVDNVQGGGKAEESQRT